MTEHTRDPLRPVRDFLYQVRDGRRAIANLEKRISLRRVVLELNKDDGMEQALTGGEIERMERELAEKRRTLASTILAVSDMISRLDDANQQMVLTYRYIDGLSDWYEIADKVGMSKPTVQKLHGRALPQLQQILNHLYGQTAKNHCLISL